MINISPVSTIFYGCLFGKEVCAIAASLTKKTVDHSTFSDYIFSFHCDLCDKSWQNAPIPFDAGCSALANETLRDVLWAQERRFAFSLASMEALFHFNNCPSCGNWVCDECFKILDEMDICKECAKKKDQ